LLWEEAKYYFDPDAMGFLPDVRVPDTSVEDRQALLDLVKASGWQYEYSTGDSVTPLPEAEAALFRPAEAETPSLRVWPDAEVLMIFRFYDVARLTSMLTCRSCRASSVWICSVASSRRSGGG
jgi:hypothetical protein